MKTASTAIFSLLLAQLASCRGFVVPAQQQSSYSAPVASSQSNSGYGRQEISAIDTSKRAVVLVVDHRHISEAPSFVKRNDNLAIVPYKAPAKVPSSLKAGRTAKVGGGVGMSKTKMAAVGAGVVVAGAAVAGGITKLIKGRKDKGDKGV